jgi:putative two-component system response regulator
VQGARIAEPLRSVRDAVPLIRWHHERLDGRGYPDGLMGGAIPLLVRILSVADVYDSLSSARPYRGAIPHPQCVEILQRDASGGGLDQELVNAFCKTVTANTVGVIHRATRLPDAFLSREAASTSVILKLS